MRGEATRHTKRQLIFAGVAAPIIHVATVALLGAVWPGYSHTRDAVSVLGMSSVEIAPFMNVVGFGVTGLLVCVFSVAFVAVLGFEPAPLIASVAWLGAGATFVALGVWPYPELYHSEFLMYCSGLAILGMVAGAIAMSRDVRSMWLWPVTIFAVVGILAYFWLSEYRWSFGVLQRIHLVGAMLWLEVAALHLWKIEGNAH